MAELGIEFSNIGQVTYTEEDIANLKNISKKIKNEAQEEINPFTGKANALNLPPNDEDLPEEPLSEETLEKIDEYINPDSNEVVIGTDQADLFDNYHNFYINFFKYLKYFLGTHLTKGYKSRTGEVQYIKNFSFNYGSQIMSSIDYYDGASYELPFAKINLVDVRPMDNVQYISRQSLGKTPANNIIIAENKDLDEIIFTSVQYNYINISVELSLESSAEMLDYISNINTHIPLNYTVYTPKYYNYINISSVTKNWKKEHTYYGLIVIPSNTYSNKLYTYGKLEFEPSMELTNVTQSVSKETNENTLTLDFIFGLTVPTNVYKKTKIGIHKITTDIDLKLNNGIINRLPLLNTLTAESFIDIESDDLLKLGSKSATIKETIILDQQNLLIHSPYKILSFGTEINFGTLLKDNYSGIGFWKKRIYTDLLTLTDDTNIEKFIPINYLFNEKAKEDKVFETIVVKQDPTKDIEENIDILFNGGILNGIEFPGIYSWYDIIYDESITNKVFRFCIIPTNNLDDIYTLEENSKLEIFPTDTNFHYLIKSKYILAEADEIDNPQDYYNSILLYN